MIIKILICDDEKSELQKIKSLLDAYESLHQELRFEINCFSSVNHLCRILDKTLKFDIVFLDICMPDITGIEVAKKLKQLELECEIVFFTSSKEYALDAFSLDVRQYLLKPVKKDEMFHTLDKLIKNINFNHNNCILIKSNNKLCKVWLNDIVYSETHNNYQHITLINGSLCTRMTSSELYSLLCEKKQFIRCGASFVINLEHVAGLTSKTVEMVNGENIPVPRGSYSQLKDQFFNYYFEEE